MLLPIYVLFISESYKREKEAQGVNESNGFARYRILVSLIEINCVITGIILSYIYKMYSSLQDGCGSGTTAQLSSNSPDSSSIHNCLTVRLGMLKPSFASCWSKTFAAFICNRPFAGGPQFPTTLLWYRGVFVVVSYTWLCSPPPRNESTLPSSRDACSKVLGVEVLLAARKWVTMHREHKKWRNNKFGGKLQMVKHRRDIESIKTGSQSHLSMSISHH